MLSHLSDGKGVIQYEKLKSCKDLDARPEGEFFVKSDFFSLVKTEIISKKEYKKVTNFWIMLHPENISSLVRYTIFKIQIILCEIFENRANEMTKQLPYNPRKCPSASLISGCIHFYLPKTTITFPTQADFVDLFEKTLIGGFSCCLNTHLAFDSKNLFPEDSNSVRKKKSQICL